MNKIGWFCPHCGTLMRSKREYGGLTECECKPVRYDAHAFEGKREPDEWVRECQSMWERVFLAQPASRKLRKHWHEPVRVH